MGRGKNENLDEVADSDGRNQQHDHGFNGAHAKTLQSQKEQHIETGDDDCPQQWDVKQQVEGYGAP